MKIIDKESGKTTDSIVLCLTRAEMVEMRDTLSILIESEDANRHEHIDDEDFQKEITICFQCAEEARCESSMKRRRPRLSE